MLWISGSTRFALQGHRCPGPIISAKAEFSTQLGVENFGCSNGWFANFKKRYQLKFTQLHGESASADVMGKNEWLQQRWPALRRNFEVHQIWNAHETGLLFRALSERTFLHPKENMTSGGKKAKVHLTVLFCASLTGQKRFPFVVGKSKKPRCFNGVPVLPVRYRSNTSAWMTAALFREWPEEWNDELRRRQDKALLLIDNCMAHSVGVTYDNLQIEFLPARTTSILQPLDQGVIRTFKAHFRINMVLSLLQRLDNGESGDSGSLAKKINVLDGIINIKASWTAVSSDTTLNCWRNGGFTEQREVEEAPEIALLQPDGVTHNEWNDNVDLDAHIPSTEVTDELIIDGVLGRSNETQQGDQLDEYEEEVEIPTRSEMLAHVERLRSGLITLGPAPRKIEEIIKRTNQNLKQSKISDF